MSGEATGAQLAALSAWIDAGNAHRDPEAAMLTRFTKIATEYGEVMEALHGAIGENPRKGITDTWEHVDYELLDVATCALAAWEHRNGNRGGSLAALTQHVEAVAVRALGRAAGLVVSGMVDGSDAGAVLDRLSVYLEPRDWWIGYYRGDTHHYVCPLPCVVIRWKRRPPRWVRTAGAEAFAAFRRDELGGRHE